MHSTASDILYNATQVARKIGNTEVLLVVVK